MLPLSSHSHSSAHRTGLSLTTTRYGSNVFGNVRSVGSRTAVAKSRPGHLVRTTQVDKTVGQDNPQPQETVKTDVEPLDWNKVWYAVAVENDLNPLAPKHVELLGRDFVLWNEKGEWRCFEDVCPHRLAPLSEGRIEPSDGSLMCSYHGWRFDGEGNCVDIPQVRAAANEENSPCKSRRSKATTFPVRVAGGMVWVWPDASPSAYIDSSMIEPFFGDIDPETTTILSPLYMREVPYPVDVLIENVVDPSHVPYSHHGVQGNRDLVGWMEAKLEDVPKDSNVTIRTVMTSLLRPSKKGSGLHNPEVVNKEPTVVRELEFLEPSTALYSFMKAGKRTGNMIVNMTPCSAEKSKLFFRVVLVRTLPWFAKLMVSITRPKWRAHLNNTKVLDGDMVLLRAQARILREAIQQGKPWGSKVFAPSSADLMIIKFRSWFHGKRGGGGPKLPNGELMFSGPAGAPLHKEEILDRLHTHTKECKICSGAMRNFGILEKCANVVAAALSVSMLVMVQTLSKSGGAEGGPIGKLVCVGLGILVALFVSLKSKDIKQQFVYTGYDHWAM